MSNAFIRKIFSRSQPRGEQPTDYESLEASGSAGVSAEYERLILLHLKRWGVTESCASVEARQIGQSEDGREIIVGLVRLGGWERKPALRLMLGLPMLEEKVRKSVAGLWLADVSQFAGLWLNAAGQLHASGPVSELRQLVVSLTGPRAQVPRKPERADPTRPSKL